MEKILFPKHVVCSTRKIFDAARSRGEIEDSSVCFIEDTKEISTFSVFYGGGNIDSELSDSSENAIMNKAVKAYVDGIVGDINSVLDEINGETNNEYGI